MRQIALFEFRIAICAAGTMIHLLLCAANPLEVNGQFAKPGTPATLQRDEFARILRALESPFAHGQERDRAADALRRHGTNSLPLMMEELRAVGAIEATNPVAAMDRKLRLQAAFEIVGPVAKPIVPQLIAELKAGRSLGNAAHALAQIGGDEAQRALVEAITNADLRIRIAGACAASYLRDNPEKAREAVLALLVAIGDSSAVLRSVAVDTLGILRTNPESVIPALVRVAESDPDSVIRALAIKSIERFGAIPVGMETKLEKIAATDIDPHVRKMAARALETLRKPR